MTVKQFLEENGIKKENLLYLPIAEPFFSNILNGTKKVEFRALTDFYMRKMIKTDSEGNDLGDKPIKYVDFRNGYAKNAKRAIVELKDWGCRYADVPTEDRVKKFEPFVYEEIEREGFTDEDEFMMFILGDVVAIDIM